jgi:hypothetical protein
VVRVSERALPRACHATFAACHATCFSSAFESARARVIVESDRRSSTALGAASGGASIAIARHAATTTS